MLNQRVDIVEAVAPFLLSMPDGSWHLVINIEKPQPQEYVFQCISEANGEFNHYSKTIPETPFHVAENIWELSYGVEIMTLLHDNLANHPATMLWQQWKQHQSNPAIK